jgi:uncharacterized oxidoreductase
MQTTNNTILITGGSTGIGLALAETFVSEGNEVLICARRESKLLEAKNKISNLHIRVCDIGKKAEREALYQWATTEFPHINMLINNAGIQKEIDFTMGASNLNDDESEIEINFTAAVHLSALFIPYFQQQKKECALVNVTSGLAFIPLKIVPVYCATKAALHTFTVCLRTQLRKTNIHVFEIAPPIVKTELHKEAKARKQSARGISSSVVAEETLKAIRNNHYEKIVGRAKVLKGASRIAPNFFHKLLNKLAAGDV